MDESAPAAPPHPARTYAFVAGIGGALAAAVVSVKGILSSGSSTAAIGFVFVPFIAIAASILAGVWGLALGTVVSHHRGARPALRPVLIMAWVVAVAAPAAVAWEVAAGFALQRAVHALAPLDAAGLEAAQEGARFRDNKFFLGALAQHRQASPRLLERIASLPEPELREAMGSLWDVMGENRKGVSVMRLVARHPSTEPAVLARLADGANEDLLHEVLRNARTPQAVLARHYESESPMLQWALALNPQVPVRVLERLATSRDAYTRMNLTWNEATPQAVLQRLAADEDALVARSAAQALERRAKRGSPPA